MANFKIGDVVQLKSGGPQMTVTEIRNADKVALTWYFGEDPAQPIKTAYVHSDALNKIED